MIQINLLPVREERRKADVRQLAVLLGATVLGSLLVTGLFHAKVKADVSEAQDLLTRTKAEIEQHKPQLQKVESYRKTKEQIERKLGVIDRLDRSRSGPVRMLDELASHTPERLWLTRLQTDGGALTIEGMSLDNEVVANFLTELGNSPYFSNVELRETEATQVEGLKLNRFQLTANLLTPSDEAPDATATTAMAAGAGR